MPKIKNKQQWFQDNWEKVSDKEDFEVLGSVFACPKSGQLLFTYRCRKCLDVKTTRCQRFFLGKGRCQACYFENIKGWPKQRIIDELNNDNSEEEYSLVLCKELNGTKDKIKLRCNNCQQNWDVTVLHFFYTKSRCPNCKKFKRAYAIEKYIMNLGLQFQKEKTFSGCKYKNLLRFDFYIESLNLCVEHNGEQHYTPHRRNEKGVTDLEKTKIRDNIKVEFCRSNDIKLEIIRYDEDLDKRLSEIFG